MSPKVVDVDLKSYAYHNSATLVPVSACFAFFQAQTRTRTCLYPNSFVGRHRKRGFGMAVNE